MSYSYVYVNPSTVVREPLVGTSAVLGCCSTLKQNKTKPNDIKFSKQKNKIWSVPQERQEMLSLGKNKYTINH